MTGCTRKVGKSTEEQLTDEFKRYIGPMALTVFSELKDKGLSKTALLGYIDGLANQGILKDDDAKAFKNSVTSIMGGESAGEQPAELSEEETGKLSEESIGDSQTEIRNEKRGQGSSASDNKEGEGRKGPLKRLFGGN